MKDDLAELVEEHPDLDNKENRIPWHLPSPAQNNFQLASPSTSSPQSRSKYSPWTPLIPLIVKLCTNTSIRLWWMQQWSWMWYHKPASTNQPCFPAYSKQKKSISKKWIVLFWWHSQRSAISLPVFYSSWRCNFTKWCSN